MSKAKRKTRFDGTEGDCYEFIEKMAYLSQGEIINCRKLNDFEKFFDRIPI